MIVSVMVTVTVMARKKKNSYPREQSTTDSTVDTVCFDFPGKYWMKYWMKCWIVFQSTCTALCTASCKIVEAVSDRSSLAGETLGSRRFGKARKHEVSYGSNPKWSPSAAPKMDGASWVQFNEHLFDGENRYSCLAT